MDPDDALSSRRGRRALPLIATAITVTIVATLLYLRPIGPPKTGFVGVPPPPQLDGRFWPDFYFVTPSLGWAALADMQTNSLLVYHTSDAAKNWTRQLIARMPTNESPSIQFFDQAHGLVYAGALYRTSDGGTHWEPISLPDGTPNFSFASPVSGWAVDYGQPSRPIYATTDGGLTWRTVGSAPDAVLFAKGGISQLEFRASGEAWTGTNGSEPSVYATFDGGASWRTIGLPVPHVPVANPVPGKPFVADFNTFTRMLPSNGVLVQVDSPGAVADFISLDSGATWSQVPAPPPPTGLGDIAFVDARHWWAERLDTMFKTSDAGRTWSSFEMTIDVPGDWRVDTAHPIDARHGWLTMTTQTSFAVRSQARMLMTTSDGGAHWSPVNVPRPA